MKNDDQDNEEHQDDVESTLVILEIEFPKDSRVNYLNQKPSYDKLINVQAIFQNNNTLEKGEVVGRSMTLEVVVVGSCDETPELNSIVCDVEFSDDKVK